MMDFLLNISQYYYYGVSLLKRHEEINQFGEVAMSRGGGICIISIPIKEFHTAGQRNF